MKYKGKTFEDEQIIEKYRELNNVWKVGEYFGISGQSVHSFLTKIGVIHKLNYFTDDDKKILVDCYNEYANKQELKLLAKKMGRTVSFLNKKAKELGLTNKYRKYTLDEERRAKLSDIAKKRISKYGHPRGMLGKKHTEAHKLFQSIRTKKLWMEHKDTFINEKRLKKMSDKMSDMQLKGELGVRSRTYITRLIIGNKDVLLKSNWEFNIALLLEYKKQIGEIDEWEYESKIFKFDYNNLGIRSYRPDFTILKNNEEIYLEVKGWKDEKSKRKEILMKEYYPEISITLLDEKKYFKIEKEYKGIITIWDYRKTIKNDNLCVKIVAEKFVDKENPRVEFKIVTID